MPEYSVRVAALDGTWETVGADRQAGVWPEGLELSADGWGGKSCTFDLRRDPAAVWPDISAFTPVEVDVEGQLAWSGRVSETPSRDGTDRVMSVVCEGWQHHLDDDLVDRMWVHTRMTDWVDQRSRIDQGLSNHPASATVQVGSGGIVLGWAQGAQVPASGLRRAAVVLDLGPGTLLKRIVIDYQGQATDANNTLACILSDLPDVSGMVVGQYDLSSSVANSAGSSGQLSVSGAGRRYAHIFVSHAVSGTFGFDVLWKITGARVFGETAFESGGQSALKASTVVSDVLDRGTPLLSTDRSGITATSFSLPEYAPDGPRTPREHIGAVNAFHGWMAKVDPDRRMVFGPEPSRPKFTLGDWSAVELQDASQNSGGDIYNRVLVTGQDPAGSKVSVSRSAIQALGTSATVEQSDITVTNPSFDTNTTGWSAGSGSTISRTTTAGEFDSSPGALKVVNGSGQPAANGTITGTAKKGRAYVITARMRAASATYGGFAINQTPSLSGGAAATSLTTSFQTLTAVWVPSVDVTNPTFVVAGFTVGVDVFVDTIVVRVATASLPDRRSFTRTKQLQVSPTLPSDGVAAQTLGDAWLTSHATTPFRGTVVATGPDAIRDRTSGQPIPLHQLLRDTGELIHISDRVNPDTGAMGRDARITAVTYKPDTDQATITLDNTRSDLDALLSRLAVVQGAG